MKTYAIPEGATHVLVVDGPVSFITPADGEHPLEMFSNNQRKTKPSLSVRELYDRTKTKLPHELRHKQDRMLELIHVVDMDVSDMAEATGLASTTITNYINGHGNPSKVFLEWLADRTEVDVLELVERRER